MTTFLSKIKASDDGENVFQVELKKSVTQTSTVEYDGVVYIKAKDEAEAKAKMQEYIMGRDIMTYQDEGCTAEAEEIEYIDWEKDLWGYPASGYDEDGKAEFDISGIYPVKD